MQDKNDIYSFDENSIIHLCALTIPLSYRFFFDYKLRISHKNHGKLQKLSQTLKELSIPKYKFIPSHFEQNAVSFLNELIETYSRIPLPNVLKNIFAEQLKEFNNGLDRDYLNIVKSENFQNILAIFIQNERVLKKGVNIPEDDDCMILAALQNLSCKGDKYIITHDEHFWGYKDILEAQLKIKIVEAWKCHLLCDW